MSHWLLNELDNTRKQALKQASHALIARELYNVSYREDNSLIMRTAEALVDSTGILGST
jgi:hypothetical protein